MSSERPKPSRQLGRPQNPEPAGEGRGAPMVGVLEAEPSLGSHLDPSSMLAAKREAFAPLLSLDRGKLNWEKIPMEAGHSLGMLVLEGMLSRRQDVGDLTFVELLGEGDLLRPWSAEESTTLASA